MLFKENVNVVFLCPGRSPQPGPWPAQFISLPLKVPLQITKAPCLCLHSASPAPGPLPVLVPPAHFKRVVCQGRQTLDKQIP